MTAGPVGYRGGSDSISSIQGGAESHLGGGEVRPFSPGYDPSVDPGAGLWRDPNAVTESDSPFGLDDACADAGPDPEFEGTGEFALDDQWTQVAPGGGPTGPITIEQVIGLTAALAAKVSQVAFDQLLADFNAHLADGDPGGGGGVTIGQVNAAIASALSTLTAAQVLVDRTNMPNLVGAGVTQQQQFNEVVYSTLGTYLTYITDNATAIGNKQDHTPELDVLGALSSTATGRQLLTAASFPAVRALLGLASVEDTADADKPVSTAAQAALDAKAPLASPTLTGVPTAPTAPPGTDSTQIATTAFVLANAPSSSGFSTTFMLMGA